jgi:hypothetical protein
MSFKVTDDQRLRLDIVKTKFNYYFDWTTPKSGVCPRSVLVDGGGYMYPNGSMVTDLTVLWSFFVEVYEALGKHVKLAELVQQSPELMSEFDRIVEGTSPVDPDGEFWHIENGQLVQLQKTVDKDLKSVLKTLRNGFAHSLWCYDNLSALEYWKKRGWDTQNAPVEFKIQDRPAKNYRMYIADGAPKFDPKKFWTTKDLRILVTASTVLRYHLHLILNFVLNNSRVDIFGYTVTYSR